MNRLISIGLILILAVLNGRAQDSNAPTTDGTPFPAAIQATTESLPPSSKAIVLVIDADAQESEMVKDVIAALEKAGIATGQSAETAPPTNSPISVTLGMRKDESYDKIKQLIEAIKDAGVQQISIRVGGVSTEGEEERNILILHLQQGFTRDELHKIESAATTKADQCGLRLFIATQNLSQPAGEFFGPAVVEEQPEDNDRNISFSPSSQKVIPGTNTATISNTSKISELREAYESESKFTLSLADVLRQIQNSKDPARIAQFAANKEILRTKVHRAFTLRQSLLQAELLEMQARMEKTQQSLDRRDRMADQIVDRRVEDLLNPQLKRDNDRPIESTPPITSKANTPSMFEPAGPVSELEGDWHLVTDFDHQGEQREMSPTNWTICGAQRSIVWPGGGYDCRIKVDPIKKTLRSYSKDENGSYGEDYYELKGNQLILRNKPDAVGYEVFERGHVRIPSVVPLATQEQIVLWRSAIAEIVVFSMNSQAPRERVIGRGVVISSDGKILSQMSVIENGDLAKEKIKARFDDGTVIPLKLIEEAGQGWSVLLPELPIRVNHYFELSTSEVQLQDEVRAWRPEDSPFLSESLAPFGNTVTALDRKYPPLGIAVWQLRFSRRAVLGTPILDADGHLLGITITGAQDLLLAIPVAELRAMFPKSLGLLKDAEKAAEFPTIP